MKAIGALLFALLLVAIGAAGGFYLRSHAAAVEVAAAAKAEAEAPVVDDEDFEEETLANLGVEVGTLEAGRHVVTRSLHGVVADPSLWRRPMSAPFAGLVSELLVRPGDLVRAGDVVMRVVRDDLPVPQLTFAQGMLAPMDEELHDLYVGLRTATSERNLAQSEVDRLTALAGDGSAPLVSAEERFRAQQALQRADQAVANFRAELHVHGFGDAHMDAVAGGGHPLRDQEVRIAALRHHGLWGEAVQQVFDSLPDGVQGRSWTVAAIGELQSVGLWTPDLHELLVGNSIVQQHFRSAMGLILTGSSVPRVAALAEQGALEPLMELRAPADAPDWDVTEVLVRPGARVTAGETVVRLDRPAEMWLRLEPLGDEVAMVRDAMQRGEKLRAIPLVADAGPVFEGLTVQRVAVEGGRTVAFVSVANEPLEGTSGQRSWSLQAGVRYRVELPTEVLEGVFVVPRDAVTDMGPNRILFEGHGFHFHEFPVRVLYEDSEVAVLPVEGSHFKPGDSIVVRGAFALAQAMQLEGGGGHAHAHPH